MDKKNNINKEQNGNEIYHYKKITFNTNSNKIYMLPTIYCLGEEYYAEFGVNDVPHDIYNIKN